MKLAELQRQMLTDVMEPVAPRRASYIKPNDRLSARERLEIYNLQYWSRLVDSLRDDFPGLLRVLGECGFRKMAIAYLRECPSRSFTLRDLGASLPGWLAGQEEYTGLAIDMALLEWAHVETYDAADSPPLGPEDLASLTPELSLSIQPHIRLLLLRYAVDDVRLSNLSARAAKRREPESIYLATHRVDGDVFYRRLESGEFALLKNLASGKPISKALRGLPATPEDMQRWFATWAQLGWLSRAFSQFGDGRSGCHPAIRTTAIVKML